MTTTTRDYLGVMLAGQCFGIPVERARDVLGPQTLTPVPLAPRAIIGLLNLRGRIVTALDLRRQLGMAAADQVRERNLVVVDIGGENYALAVDGVRDVMSIADAAVEPAPPQLDPHWRSVTEAVYPAERGLIVLLDVDKLLAPGTIALVA